MINIKNILILICFLFCIAVLNCIIQTTKEKYCSKNNTEEENTQENIENNI